MSRATRKMVNLSIEETSGVDHPAHLHEGWLVMKAASEDDLLKAMTPMKTEDGVEFPAAAFAYVPDAQKPSTWKLRLWDSPEERVTARQVGMAVAALGEGFRGQKVDIPPDDLAEVKDKVRRAWLEANPDREDELPSMLKAVKEAPVQEQDIPVEDFLKEAPEAVRKMFSEMLQEKEAAVAKAAEVEEALRKERDERADAEAVAKARDAFGALGMDPGVVGPALRRLNEFDADLAKSVEQALTAANAKVESADIFSEIGKAARPTGDAYGQAEAMAKAAVADGRFPTFEQALSDVFTSNPSLYSQYTSEQGK